MSPSHLSRAGLVGLVFGLAGAVLGIVYLFWPEHSAEDLFRYPFTRAEFFSFQTLFFVQHIGLVVLLVALARTGAVRGRVFPIGMWLAVFGMALLSFAEVMAMRYVDAALDATNEGVMGTVYAVACLANGLGLVLAGASMVRARTWAGWRRWTVLASGLWLFVAVTPGLFAGFVVGRLVITAWMLLYAVVGWSLYVESAEAGSRRVAPTRRPMKSALP